jgi:hypothetical protein
MSRVLFNVPKLGIQRPLNFTNLIPHPELLLFPRHVVYNMATKLGLGGGYLENASAIPYLRDSLEASNWMAGKEREILWPLLADHYLLISESHGWNKPTGPEVKMADANSSHILFVHRSGVPGRFANSVIMIGLAR